MIVLGIDQGLSDCGYSIIDFDLDYKGNEKPIGEKEVKLIEYGIITTTSKEKIEKRIYKIASIIENAIIKYNPELICCEHLFYTPPAKGKRNKSSSIVNTNAITGVLIYMAGKYNIKFSSFIPGHVKKIICDNGKATKDDMISKITSFFEVECSKSKEEHICDSISIGITGAKDYKEDLKSNEETMKAEESVKKEKVKKNEENKTKNNYNSEK
jgi:crossover junction endodeoxyribonuclease RuvC